MSRNVVTVSIGAMGILVGISIMFASNDQMQTIRVAGGIIALLGIAMCLISYKLAIDESFIHNVLADCT